MIWEAAQELWAVGRERERNSKHHQFPTHNSSHSVKHPQRNSKHCFRLIISLSGEGVWRFPCLPVGRREWRMRRRMSGGKKRVQSVQ